VRKKRKLGVLGVGIIFVICALAALLISRGFNKAQPAQTSGVLIDIRTGADSGYSIAILRLDDIENDLVRDWAGGILRNEAAENDECYHTLYNNSSEAMDMYLFSPAANKVIGGINVSNVRVTESGTALIISIDTDEDAGRVQDGADLILHIFATDLYEYAVATSEVLIVNGRIYTFISSTFMALGQ
jgi:hypothetical protein